MAAGKNFTKEQKEQISATISNVEEKTSGEILPIIVHSSDLYSASHYRCSGFFTLTGMILICLFAPALILEEPLYLLVCFLIFSLLGHALSWNKKIKRIFTKSSEIETEVYQRAIQAFHEHGIVNTTDRNGILIFISLFERQILILADKGIDEKVDKKLWQKMVKSLSFEIYHERLLSGLQKAIEECGTVLAKHFPKTAEDKDEINNQVIVEDT